MITAVPMDKLEGPRFRGCVSPSQGPATVHPAGGTTPLKLPGGPTGLDLMNVGHRELPLYVYACVCACVCV